MSRRYRVLHVLPKARSLARHYSDMQKQDEGRERMAAAAAAAAQAEPGRAGGEGWALLAATARRLAGGVLATCDKPPACRLHVVVASRAEAPWMRSLALA